MFTENPAEEENSHISYRHTRFPILGEDGWEALVQGLTFQEDSQQFTSNKLELGHQQLRA